MPKPRIPRTETVMDEVIGALQMAGASTQVIANGATAVLCGLGGVSFVLVVRSGSELTQDQLNWVDRWRGGWCAVGSGKQAVDVARRIASETLRLKPETVFTNGNVWPKSKRAGNSA